MVETKMGSDIDPDLVCAWPIEESDIVIWLRKAAKRTWYNGDGAYMREGDNDPLESAANEIERLRAELADVKAGWEIIAKATLGV